MTWLGEHSSLAIAVVNALATITVALINKRRIRIADEKIKQNAKDIDGVALAAGTTRALARAKSTDPE